MALGLQPLQTIWGDATPRNFCNWYKRLAASGYNLGSYTVIHTHIGGGVDPQCILFGGYRGQTPSKLELAGAYMAVPPGDSSAAKAVQNMGELVIPSCCF